MKKIISPALILVALLSFAASSSPDTLTRAVHYIVSEQEENGAWSRLRGEFPAEAEPTSWGVKVLSMNGHEAERVQKGVAFLLKDQKPDGSWNDNTAHTAFALLALMEAGKGGEAVRKGIAYLRGVQDGVGGFRRMGLEGAPLTVYTAVVLEAFKAAGFAADDPAVKKGISWLKSCQNKDGGYGIPKGSSSVAVGSAWCVRALRELGAEPAAPEVRRGAECLLTMQTASGGFAMTPSGQADPEITAYAIMALGRLPGSEAAIARAVDYLGKVQHEDGSFTSAAPVQFGGRPRKNTQTTMFVAWALSEKEPRP
jgi:hypothetical protein